MRPALLIAALALASCAPERNTTAPYVIARSPGNILILSGAASHIQESMTLATTECRQQGGGVAVQRSATILGDRVSGSVRIMYECVRGPDALPQ
ncbi:hypothetical protein UFOVP99_6 [uncultured Caudovirales phage]|uniref:Lipoprotein n=1 Tax=uncultured Caudovirales phage TaxID=2100421 RepID=A0A6J5L127_9CAUD|nr:hypothetical protein UFOVP99_6 [uncultured Caudovirales phage]